MACLLVCLVACMLSCLLLSCWQASLASYHASFLQRHQCHLISQGVNVLVSCTCNHACVQSLLPWDFNRWGGLPTDVEANVAQGFRLREQQHQQQQQQQQAQQQAQQQQHQHSAVLAQRAADSDFRHQSNDFSYLQPSPQSGDPQGGHHQLGSHFQYNLPSTSAGMTQADQYGFPEALSGEEGGNEAFLAYSRRLMRQGGSERQALLPWGTQVGLFCKFVCLCNV